MNQKYSLKANHEIKKLVDRKKSVGSKYYVIYYQNAPQLQVAYSISKKYGSAVERNYGKRVTREIFRKNLQAIPNVKMMIVIKPLTKELTFIQKEEQIIYLINKLKKEIKNGA